MRSLFLLSLLTSLLPMPARAQHAADSSAVLATIRALDSAWDRKDTVAVGRLLASEYRYFSSMGSVRTRAQILEFLGAPDYRVERAQRSALEPHITGGTAVVSSRWQGRGSWSGGTFDDDQRCSLVLVKQQHGWRVLAEHCTQIRPES